MYFKKFIQHLKKLEPEMVSSSFLVAVSGGIDSVVLAHLFKQSNCKFSIAHCNFSLRGDESDGDELLVKNLAKELNVPFFSKRFDTLAYAENQKLSIQEAARKLRYDWFFELLVSHHFNKVAIAHHHDDAVETFFINLQRGSGVRGLSGITENSDKIIRPLLIFTRDQIVAYAKQNNIAYRNDSSNQSNDYLRNNFRNNLTPYIASNFPKLLDGIATSIQHLNDEKMLLEFFLEKKKQELKTEKEGSIEISISAILEQDLPKQLLYQILRDYGFTKTDSDNLFLSLLKKETKYFLSDTHRAIKQRDAIVIDKIKENESAVEYTIQENTTVLETPVKMRFSIKNKTEINLKEKIATQEYIDFDLLQFPLQLRKYRVGDSFYPLGMDKPKKLSDFFIDNKFSESKKENTWLLLSNSKIVWVIGERVDNRFKITDRTVKVLELKLL